MGGSTNTVLHLLAMAREAEVNFTMADIDRLSRQVPCICKVAPATQEFHIEDVARAGGIMSILGELLRGGKIHPEPQTVAGLSLGELIATNDIRGSGPVDAMAVQRALAGPRATCGRKPPSPRTTFTLSRTPTIKRAVSARSHTLIRRMAGWPCFSATSPRKVAS